MKTILSSGPWDFEHVGVTSMGPDGVDVYEVTNGYKRIAEHLTEADARAIAAVPAMLQTLVALREYAHEMATSAHPSHERARKLLHQADCVLEMINPT